jgi:hypothetical protein
MRGVNNRNFFNSWQILYRATCPGASEARWRVDDVEWRKDRHSFFGSAYAISLEVHLLSRAARGGAGWVLMVVVENWWSDKHDALKTSTWARVVEGTQKAVVAWMREREHSRDRAQVRGT